jgi:hypothetical protein
MIEERICGDCTLCCTLLPVVPLNKKGGERCKHQRSVISMEGAGCAVYRKKGFPGECGLWNCRWLVDPSTSKLLRPDISHYVIDIIPDFVRAQEGGREVKVPVIQVWIDPRYPDAHRDPALRAWLSQNEPECLVLVRYSESEAITLIPPHMSDTHQWEEVGGERMQTEDRTHSGEEIAAVLTNTGAMK